MNIQHTRRRRLLASLYGGVALPPPPSYTHWRVLWLSSFSPGFVGAAEIEFRATVGGADISGTGTPISGAERTGFEDDLAFDNNTATAWSASKNTQTSRWWVGVDFAADTAVAQVAITARTPAFYDQAPSAFKVQKSSDGGLTWTDVLNVFGEQPWTAGETRTYNITAGQQPGGIVYATSTPSDDAVGVAVDAAVSMIFSDTVVSGAGTFLLWDIDGASFIETFTPSAGTGDNGGTVGISGDTVTLTPGANLVEGTQYAVMWTAGAVEDTFGNAIAANSTETLFNFTAVAPQAGFSTAGTIPAQPLVGTPIGATAADAGGTPVTYQWYRGDPAGAGTAISLATSQDYTPVDADFNVRLYRRASSAGYTADLAAPEVTGAVWSDTWESHTIGDAGAQLGAAGWTRAGADVDPVVQADANSPSGRSIGIYGAGNPDYMSRDDYVAFLTTNAAGVSYIETVHIIEYVNPAPSDSRFAMRMMPAGDRWSPDLMGPGFNCRIGSVYHQLEGDNAGESQGQYIMGLTPGTTYVFRHRVEGSTSKLKVWDITAAEPAAWTSERIHTGPITSYGPNIFWRYGVASPKNTLQYFSVGANAAPPVDSRWTLIAPVSSDPYGYAASATMTSFTQFDNLITYTLEDIP